MGRYRLIRELLNEKDLECSNPDLISDAVLTYAWKDWRKA
jgi:hypothetical protein